MRVFRGAKGRKGKEAGGGGLPERRTPSSKVGRPAPQPRRARCLALSALSAVRGRHHARTAAQRDCLPRPLLQRGDTPCAVTRIRRAAAARALCVRPYAAPHSLGTRTGLCSVRRVTPRRVSLTPKRCQGLQSGGLLSPDARRCPPMLVKNACQNEVDACLARSCQRNFTPRAWLVGGRGEVPFRVSHHIKVSRQVARRSPRAGAVRRGPGGVYVHRYVPRRGRTRPPPPCRRHTPRQHLTRFARIN